jgi:hypothetical protein
MNGNWMDAASVNAHDNTSCLYKKLLDLFFRVANISLKHSLNAVETGYFVLQYVIFSQNMKIDGFICG